VLPNLLVEFGGAFGHAGHQFLGKPAWRRRVPVFVGHQGTVESRERVAHGETRRRFGILRIRFRGSLPLLPVHIPQIKDLQGSLARPVAGRHGRKRRFQEPARNARIRLPISTALMAASKPLLPLLAPARSMACSSVLVVSTPKAIGTPVCNEV